MEKDKIINGYQLYTNKPNTISSGFLYTKEIFVNVNNEDKHRLVRVYLPSNYDFDNPKKRFAVMYMLDGKNLFDTYTSFVGEWNVDEIIEDHVAKADMGLIVVGIDSAKNDDDRTNEMLIESKHYDYNLMSDDASGYGSILAEYILNTLKPEIDSTFNTLSDRAHTAIGGASMGGLFAFYIGAKYADRISFSLCFSPAFALYGERYFMSELTNQMHSNDKYGKFMFFIGGDDLEKTLKPLTLATYNHLKSIGFDSNQVKLISDDTLNHNEDAWSRYYDNALSFWGVLNN